MKIGKGIKIGVLVVVVLLVVAVVIVIINIDSIVKSVVQSQTQASLNVPTKLGGAHVSILAGGLKLSDLSLGSPQGFSAPEMFAVGGIGVNVNYGQLRNQPIHVKEVTIDKPVVVLEQAGGKFNISAIMDSGPKEGNSAPPSGEPMKVVIDDVKLTNAMVKIRPGLPGINAEIPVPIPSVELHNVGNDSGQNGAAMKEVVLKIMQALGDQASNSDSLPPEVKQLLKLDINHLAQSLGGDVKKIGEQVQNQVQGVTKDLGKNVGDSVQKGLGDVFGKKK